jgi:hypothetical protein
VIGGYAEARLFHRFAAQRKAHSRFYNRKVVRGEGVHGIVLRGTVMIFRGILACSALVIGISLHAENGMTQSCIGTCGADTANGVVTNPPGFSSYDYVTTSGGASGVGQIPGVPNGTNGSLYTTPAFTGTSGATLTFQFNYVTSDGSGYPDYAWSAIIPAGGTSSPTYLFTARTEPTGNTSPGQGLPSNAATLNPATSAIIPGAPLWNELGSSSGLCWDVGCGYTGWVESVYTIPTTGSYQIEFGVTNQNDTLFDSGLAFAGIQQGPPLPTASEFEFSETAPQDGQPGYYTITNNSTNWWISGFDVSNPLAGDPYEPTTTQTDWTAGVCDTCFTIPGFTYSDGVPSDFVNYIGPDGGTSSNFFFGAPPDIPRLIGNAKSSCQAG